MSIEPKRPAEAPPKALDNRVFGLIFAGIFLVISLLPLIGGGGILRWSVIVSAVFAAVALILPIALTPFNILFQKFGMMMHKITNPLLMGIVFFLTVLPTGLILKLLRKDPMRRKIDISATSYWIEREHGSVTKESFDNQF